MQIFYDIHEKIFVELPTGDMRLISDVRVASGISGNVEGGQWITRRVPGVIKTREDWYDIRDGRWLFRWAIEWNDGVMRGVK